MLSDGDQCFKGINQSGTTEHKGIGKRHFSSEPLWDDI